MDSPIDRDLEFLRVSAAPVEQNIEFLRVLAAATDGDIEFLRVLVAQIGRDIEFLRVLAIFSLQMEPKKQRVRDFGLYSLRFEQRVQTLDAPA